MTDHEILEIDFYDLCGCAALWMNDEDKIKYYKECMNIKPTTPMTENKLYAQCREEARERIKKLEMISGIPEEKTIARYLNEELSQLTAEIYGMKLLDSAAKVFLPTVASGAVKYWQKDHYQNKEYYYSTKEVHNHFVEQFNKEGK